MRERGDEELSGGVVTTFSRRRNFRHEPMKILVNATTIRGGGGVQKAVEFVRASISYNTEHVYSYALSDVVTNNLRAVTALPSLALATANSSSARPIGGRATRRVLREIERRFQPDVVYSVFGPAYVTFRAPHLMGFAVPWVTHPNRHAWQTLRNPVEKTKHWAWCKYVTLWTRFADRWVLETSVAAEGLSRVLGVERERLHVVPNSCSEPYYRAREDGARPEVRMQRERPGDFNLLVFSRWYPHKNLQLVPIVAAELRRRDPTRRYRFFLTFDTSSGAWMRMRRQAKRLRVEENVVNLGPIMINDGPGLYVSSDALFLPTLLETFTATYPEAMCLRRPIVTTDLPFARDICDQAALYFPPNDATCAADLIALLADSDAMRSKLVEKGDERLAGAKTSRELYEMFIQILEVTAQERHEHGRIRRGRGGEPFDRGSRASNER